MKKGEKKIVVVTGGTYGILYLVFDESKFVTGSELVFDDGYTCKY